MTNEHRDKAVEAMAEAAFVPPISEDRIADMRSALQAAEAHLKRMYWERFREALTSKAMIEIAAKRQRLTDEAVGIAGMPQPTTENAVGAVLVAVANALDKAMEVDRGR